MTSQTPSSVLRSVFGYDDFRPGQDRAVEALMNGNDVLAVMPTGAGKSLCFQVPALCKEGITLVISPLVSLMQDQVTALVKNGVPAAYFNRLLSPGQYRTALARLAEGQYKIVYAAPERLWTPAFQEICQQLPISMVAVDEAHCVSQWGQDFRPNYLKIRDFIDSLPCRPVVGAFTATANENVQKDIVSQLGLHSPVSVQTGFDRPNLTFQVLKEKDRLAALLALVQARKDLSGIIYCATRKAVEEVCEYLNSHGIACLGYHAGMDDGIRQKNQEDFIFDRVGVIAATNAFGMGIDKPNVSYVIHYQMPGSLENYYQEAGRAGRDGSPAQCILLFAARDIQTQLFLIENGEPNPELDENMRQEVILKEKRRLSAMADYARSHSCLRNQILRYFGEHPDKPCGRCSNCLADWKEEDVTEEAMLVFAGIIRTQSRFGTGRLLDILLGSQNQFIKERHLDSNPAYGKMGHLSRKHVESLVQSLKDEGYLEVRGEYPILVLTDLARRAVRNHLPVVIATASNDMRFAKLPENDALFEELRKVRMVLAQKERVPAFIIFADSTLRDMARKKPRTKAELLHVSGVGDVKLRKYGAAFLTAVQKYCRQQEQKDQPESSHSTPTSQP